MNTWVEDIARAMLNLGGSAKYKKLYDEVYELRGGDVPRTYKDVIRRSVQSHSSNSSGFQGVDLFYSVGGLGSGHWGLRERIRATQKSAELPAVFEEPEKYGSRVEEITYRILRDTVLARTIKELHENRCQICGEYLSLHGGLRYSEAHHIRPLGTPHNGPDIRSNILVLCPNHHALCDMKSFKLSLRELRSHPDHQIGQKYVDYHNDLSD